MRRDRDGSELPDVDEREALDVDQLLHASRCRDGWIGEDAERRPIPCPRCKPHLERFRRRTRAQLLGPFAA